MWLEKLILRDFRNYENAEISFCFGTNMIQGENAQGKTNILEALSLLSTGKSFRTPHLQDVIRSGSTTFFIEAHFHKEEVAQTLSLAFDGQSKKILHNYTSYNSFISLLGILPSVLIVPEDISIIIGSPTERRRFLDMHIAQVDPLYVYHLGRYYKAMKHRNALLKQQKEVSISSWEQIMAQAAAYLILARKRHSKEILQKAQRYMQILSEEKDTLSIEYKSSIPLANEEKKLAEQILIHYTKTRLRELLIKSTLHGPHRDEIDLLINGKEAKYFGSEGQKRCFVTALHLAQRDLFEESFGSAPLVGIDDFGTHLDQNRSAVLLSHVSTLGQTFLTSPTPFSSENLLQEQKTLFVHRGTIQDRAQYDENKLVLEEML